MYDEFKGSLTRLAMSANKHRIEMNNKKILQLKEALSYLQSGKKLPLHLQPAYEDRDQLDVLNQRDQLEKENAEIAEMKER